MSIGTAAAIGISAGIGAAGSIASGAMGSSAASSAAQTQAQAAEQAAQLQYQAETNALDFDKQVYSNAQGYFAPFQSQGNVALGQLAQGSAPGGQFNSTPTSAQVMAQDPGYQFNLQQGQQAVQRAEAAGGNVGSGGALKAASQYATNYTTNAYGQAYNQFMNTRQANYGNLMSIAGLGEQASMAASNAGTGAASNFSNTSLAGANAQGNDLTSGAAASAAGTIGAANAWGGALGGVGNSASNYLMLGQLAQLQNQSAYQNAVNVGFDSEYNMDNSMPVMPNAPAYNLGV